MVPLKDREKLWPEWELNPGYITTALPTELQGKIGSSSWELKMSNSRQ